MSEIEPTFESVFTEEYWNPPPMPEFQSKKRIGQVRESWKRTHLAPDYFSKETIAEAQQMLLFAANLLVARESVAAVDEGEQIGGVNDTAFAIPDAVLLIDRETAFLRTDYLQEVELEDKKILREHELAKSALSAFMSGMGSTQFNKPRPTAEELGLDRFHTIIHNYIGKSLEKSGPPPSDYAVLNPFKKHIIDLEHGRYSRVIDLFAFCPNKKGDTASIRMSQWRNPPEGAHVTATASGSRWMHTVGFYYPGAVGETVNVTVNPKFPNYTRIREARLCLPGNLEKAKVSARSTKRSTAKTHQLATEKM